jgi:hypothetical protein
MDQIANEATTECIAAPSMSANREVKQPTAQLYPGFIIMPAAEISATVLRA